jgi:putative DNA primase/helicase
MRLGRARREGRGWRTECPVHHGYSLNLADGRDRKLLVKCWAGCSAAEIFEELRRLDLDCRSGDQLEDRRYEDGRRNDGQRSLWAERLWARAKEARRSSVETHLRSRGITIAPRLSLRWLASCKHPSGVFLPAMVAKVVNVDGELVAVHRTYLAPIEPQKASLGPTAGGAVRLGQLRLNEWLVIAEGIETTLAVMQATQLCGWAALSASGIINLRLPPEAGQVLIAADNDANGVGEAAARRAAERWLAEGREVRLALPPTTDSDFNDMLIQGEM